MKSAGLNQTKARWYAKRAQVAFLVVGVLSLTVAVLGSRPRPTPVIEPLERPLPPPVVSSKPGQVRPQPIDAHGLADRLAQIANAPTQTQKPPETNPEPTDVEPTVTDESIRFLGLVQEPTRKLALLKVGERQRLVAVGENLALSGDQTGTVRVTDVTADHVMIESDSGAHRIEKSARTGSSVTFLSSGATLPSRGNTAPGASLDAAARLHAPTRPGLSEPPVVPAPGARIMPNDRRPPGTSPGEHQ